jgi:hypothetical protein
MATSKELHAWANTLRRWATTVDATDVRELMLALAAKVEHLAECKEVAERQLV